MNRPSDDEIRDLLLSVSILMDGFEREPDGTYKFTGSQNHVENVDAGLDGMKIEYTDWYYPEPD